MPIWITAVYCPLAFMIWGGGLMSQGGAVSAVFGQVIDFAGGTVVEISSGIAALVLALIVGKRHGFGKDPGHRPHNVPFIMLGAGLLWFGWFGFNARRRHHGRAGRTDLGQHPGDALRRHA